MYQFALRKHSAKAVSSGFLIKSIVFILYRFVDFQNFIFSIFHNLKLILFIHYKFTLWRIQFSSKKQISYSRFKVIHENVIEVLGDVKPCRVYVLSTAG